MTARHMTHDDLSTLSNICLVAAERFAENAALMRRLASQEPAPEGALIPSGPVARGLAEQFDRQEAEARALANIFAAAEPFSFRHDEEELVG